MSLPNTIQEIISFTTEKISSFSDSANLDAQVLLGHSLNKNRAWILAYPEYSLSSAEHNFFTQLFDRYINGEPLPYIIGKWEFYGLEFIVNKHVLIPRPETELLVEEALKFISKSNQQLAICEAGIGSGCISVSIAKQAANLHIDATDISSKALMVAKKNIQLNQVIEVIDLFEMSLIESLPGPYDLIVANLPYIPSAEVRELPIFGKEPTLALDGGGDGFELIEQLLKQAIIKLSPGGLILLEIEANHGEISVARAKKYFPKANIRVQSDLTGRDRLLHIQT